MIFNKFEDLKLNNFPVLIFGSGPAGISLALELESKKIRNANIGKANNMTTNEKIISFLNNYFIFKKIRDPNAREITNTLLTISDSQSELGKEETKEAQQEVKPKRKRVVKKYKKKLTLPLEYK